LTAILTPFTTKAVGFASEIKLLTFKWMLKLRPTRNSVKNLFASENYNHKLGRRPNIS